MIILNNGYTQVEYIESSGAQYIDTGFIPNGNTRLVMDAEMLSTANAAYFGTRGTASSTDSTSFTMFSVGGATIRSDYYGQNASLSVDPNQRLTIDKDKNVTTIAGITQTSTASTTLSLYNLFLFAANSGGTPSSNTASMKLYSCQIYDNGMLVRDFVPCISSSGEAGLYDMVGGRFYRNAGSGSFTAGEKITAGPFTPIEYIESNGAQYINTHFTADQDTRAVIDFKADGMNGSVAAVFGARKEDDLTQGFDIWLTSSGVYYHYGAASEGPNFSNPYERITVDANKNTAVFTGQSGSTVTITLASSSFTTPGNLLLGTCGGSVIHNKNYPFIGKLYACKIYDNGTLVRDYYPAVSASGTAGLYDSVNDVFYSSAGDEEFTAGPFLSPSVPGDIAAESLGNSVTLTWSASDNADGYRIYRNGVLIGDTAETSFTYAETAYSYAFYSVSAYNEKGESGAVGLYVYISGGDVFSDLVTDRTRDDVLRRTKKGVYNAADLNRVRDAADLLHTQLVSLGYSLLPEIPERHWSVNEIPDSGELSARHSAVIAHDVLEYSKSKALPPGSMERLTYEGANAIEAALLGNFRAAELIPQAYIYSNEIFGGEDF